MRIKDKDERVCSVDGGGANYVRKVKFVRKAD
jgi:hypothetical protein